MRSIESMSLQFSNARVAVFGVLVAGVLAGCGGGSSGAGAMSATSGPNSPLAISQSNAGATAAEAILTPATLADSATTGAGVGVVSAMDRRVVQQVMQAQIVHAAGGGVTISCAASGSFTAVTSVDGKTLTVTFAECSEVAGSSVDGTQTYANFTLTTQSSSDAVSANVTDALTIVVGSVSFAVSGQYAFSLAADKTANAGYSTVTFGLTGSSLAVTASKSGAVFDSSTLTNFDFNFEDDLTVSPHQLYSSFNYVLASSRLNGEITVTTTEQLKQIVDPAETHLYPYAGQLLIAGAGAVRLQVTILGDETFVPPAGEGQIELQLDPGTGTFEPPTWVNWPALAASG
jgi:hypothetical protein